jgi:hypothetical protein
LLCYGFGYNRLPEPEFFMYLNFLVFTHFSMTLNFVVGNPNFQKLENPIRKFG